MYFQNYNPLGNVLLSTLVAAIPILTLLYFIAIHPHRDDQGIRHLGVPAPYAAFYAVIAALLVACLVFRMAVPAAISAFALGVFSGFLGIIWIVRAAMFLYTMTVITGKFEIVKESIIHISFDRRLQVLLIAFSFGAIIEGTSGFGTPVAIAGAVMVGLGFSPFQSAVLNLLANTAPVAWGAIGTPIVTLAAVSGLDQKTLSTMAGHQLPWVSVLVPFWLIATLHAYLRPRRGTGLGSEHKIAITATRGRVNSPADVTPDDTGRAPAIRRVRSVPDQTGALNPTSGMSRRLPALDLRVPQSPARR